MARTTWLARRCRCPGFCGWRCGQSFHRRARGLRAPERSTTQLSCPGNAASPGFLSLCVHANHTFDGAAADGAETDLVTREHDAILLRAVVAAPFVHGSFKRADLARVGTGAEDPCPPAALFADQRFHVGFRPVLRADGAPALLDRLLHLLELLLRPDRIGRAHVSTPVTDGSPMTA